MAGSLSVYKSSMALSLVPCYGDCMLVLKMWCA